MNVLQRMAGAAVTVVTIGPLVEVDTPALPPASVCKPIPSGLAVLARPWVWLTWTTAACSHAPSQNILGSFFPAWMLCAGLGVAAAIVCRLGLGAVGVNRFVPVAPLTYVGFAAAVALCAWLAWFGQ